mmetsp:Transcript_30332/g.89992  ORF Transcript_30332/g.89992 Transcript_30332/m.89992 type:complete len:98 (-) Transcript_30332:466-759(-)
MEWDMQSVYVCACVCLCVFGVWKQPVGDNWGVLLTHNLAWSEMLFSRNCDFPAEDWKLHEPVMTQQCQYMCIGRWVLMSSPHLEGTLNWSHQHMRAP